jgi:hypothetical protein
MSAEEPLVVAALRAELPRRLRISARVLGPGPSWVEPPDLPGRGLLVVTGSCGALERGERPGTLVIPQRVVDGSGRAREPDAAWSERLRRAAVEHGLRPEGGGLITAAAVADSPAERSRLAARTGCRWADLESAALAERAEAAGRPWVVLRFVSDTPERPLAWLAVLFGRLPAREPGVGRTLLALLRRPWLAPRLVRLFAVVARGRDRVGRVLASAGTDRRSRPERRITG